MDVNNCDELIAMCIECTDTCKNSTACKNKRIQSGSKWINALKIFQTDQKGLGIKTTQKISQNELLLEYFGKVVPIKKFYKQTDQTYGLKLDPSHIIDGNVSENICKYVNHSCNPNCNMEKWLVNGVSRMGLFTIREIDADEEITFNYNMGASIGDMKTKCKCGEKNCSGFIGRKIVKNKDKQLKMKQ